MRTQEEKDKWDNFWILKSVGREEFTGKEKEARTELDAKVWERFNNTVQRRPDGYYVRLPWIEQHPYLPDNKALAYRRLVNVWASISKEDTLLKQYNKIFREQLRNNITEQEEESTNDATGEQIHYIPHQPVITQKARIKLRIVFDVSAHYKNYASSASMTACTYLCYSATSSLVMATSILPSLQVKYTTPGRCTKYSVLKDLFLTNSLILITWLDALTREYCPRYCPVDVVGCCDVDDGEQDETAAPKLELC
ncbi:unnamed protein product [Haemonchus placei]|uniref:MADF domain-containing protein n=1 Tax=Haemonchus placei TaxID=6290 RepID=A0A0N4WCW0_HAEPC|nr:unnamed protein product [Haemonchus placei]